MTDLKVIVQNAVKAGTAIPAFNRAVSTHDRARYSGSG